MGTRNGKGSWKDRVFNQMVIDHRKTLFQYLLHQCRDADRAADCLQETLVRAYTSLDSLTDKEKTKAWLFAIARHVFLDEIRRRTIRRRELFQDTGPDLHTPEGDLVAAETAGALWREVDALPPPKPEILALRFRGGLDLNEIATVLELPLGTVKVHLFRARADLRATLARFEEK